MNRSTLTDEEVDTAMANIPPENRQWCSASCGPKPGEAYEDWADWQCACSGCIHGELSWQEFVAWQEREARLGATPYIPWDDLPAPKLPTLAERLAIYKAVKRMSVVALAWLLIVYHYETHTSVVEATFETEAACWAQVGKMDKAAAITHANFTASCQMEGPGS